MDRLAVLARRYGMLTAAIGALFLVISVAPTLAPNQTRVAVRQGITAPPSQGSAASPAAALGGPAGPAAANDTGSARPAQSPARPAPSPQSAPGSAAPPATFPANAAPCQSWTVYAPPCPAPLHGGNGGATSRGVSDTTVTVAYRMSNSTQDAAAFAALGSPSFSDAHYVSDLQTYIRWFNSHYDLYGRKVVLKPFQGTGDWLSEDQGEDLDAAQADAASSRGLGAFADIAFLYKATQPYETDLAQDGVIGIGVPGMPQTFFEQNAPYLYSPWPTGDKLAGWAVNTACDHLVGQDATFAGDTALRSTKRVFGIVTPDIPGYTASGAIMEQGLDACGAKVGRRVAYGLNIPTFQNQANSIVAQMRAAGVTTVICYCDPLMPAFLSQTADQQHFAPEWMIATLGPTDQLFRYSSQAQWAHAISNAGAFPAPSKSEAYRVFKLANPGGTPLEQFYPTAYALALELFNGIEAAGPNLTPTNFEVGMFGLPTTGTGDFGTWSYGTGAFTPGTDTQLGWWSDTDDSAIDGQPGGWQSCFGGKWFPYAASQRSAWGPVGSPLECFR